MEKRSNFRARVMKYAWQLWKTTGQAWRICLTKAWRLYYLARDMRQGVVEFYYTKADGSIRKALGTLRNVPAGATLGGKRVTKPSYRTMAYDWRIIHWLKKLSEIMRLIIFSVFKPFRRCRLILTYFCQNHNRQNQQCALNIYYISMAQTMS